VLLLIEVERIIKLRCSLQSTRACKKYHPFGLDGGGDGGGGGGDVVVVGGGYGGRRGYCCRCCWFQYTF
jgi:hypothetical protein